jgi:hypothetical protein
MIYRKDHTMFKIKVLASILLAVLILAGQTGMVTAAPQPQSTTPITGTIKSITIIKGATATDPSTVLVTVLDDQAVTHKVYISVDDAVLLELVTIDPVTKLPVVDQTKLNQQVTIAPEQQLPPPTENEVTKQQPVAKLLAAFFDVEYSEVMDLHTEGFGFGEIAQALFLAEKLDDVSLAADILNAKKTGDYSAFELEDGSTPGNWGQFRNAVLGHGKNNLGVVVSGKGNQTDDSNVPGNGRGQKPDNQNGNGNGRGHGNGKP